MNYIDAGTKITVYTITQDSTGMHAKLFFSIFLELFVALESDKRMESEERITDTNAPKPTLVSYYYSTNEGS